MSGRKFKQAPKAMPISAFDMVKKANEEYLLKGEFHAYVEHIKPDFSVIDIGSDFWKALIEDTIEEIEFFNSYEKDNPEKLRMLYEFWDYLKEEFWKIKKEELDSRIYFTRTLNLQENNELYEQMLEKEHQYDISEPNMTSEQIQKRKKLIPLKYYDEYKQLKHLYYIVWCERYEYKHKIPKSPRPRETNIPRMDIVGKKKLRREWDEESIFSCNII